MNATNVLPDEKLELNEADIKKAKVGDTLWDAKVKGLHLRVLATKKTFYLYFRTKSGIQRKPKIGDYGSISLSQARKVAGEMLTEVGAGRDPGQTRIDAKNEANLTDLWDEYWKRHGKKKKSADEDERLWKKNLAPLAKKRLSEIDYSEVADLHEDLTENNGGTTANRTLALLSTMFNFALAPLEWTDKNPCKGVARNKETKRKRYMAASEAARIAAVLHSKIELFPAGVAFIYLLILTGARKSEIANAKWDQLHGNKLILTDHKTDQDGEARVIQLPQAAVDVLAKLPKTTGTITGITSPRTMWETVRVEAGCPDLRLHDLRHSFASVAIGLGKTLAQVGELLGHKDSQTTKRYSHLMDEAAAMVAGEIGVRIMATLGMAEAQNPPADAGGSPSSATVVVQGSVT